MTAGPARASEQHDVRPQHRRNSNPLPSDRADPASLRSCSSRASAPTSTAGISNAWPPRPGTRRSRSTTGVRGAATSRTARTRWSRWPTTRSPCSITPASRPPTSSERRWAERSARSWRSSIPNEHGRSRSPAPPDGTIRGGRNCSSAGATPHSNVASARWARKPHAG